MLESTAALARAITWDGSKQSYYTARFLVDKSLVYDCYRAYAYFRWVDDVVDISAESREGRISFIERQKAIIDLLYNDIRPDDLIPEEEIIADLVEHDRGENSGLQSFIRNFLKVIEFDAYRRGSLITEKELIWYSSCLGKSITDAIQYFIKNGHPYPDGKYRYLAATAAHITHMLRDMALDLNEGYINIPSEYLDQHQISPDEIDNPHFKAWVRERVMLAREYFHDGKLYLESLDVLRCKIAGYWYCARFEDVLGSIEQREYLIDEKIGKSNITLWFKMIVLALSVSLRHFFQMFFLNSWWSPSIRRWRLKANKRSYSSEGKS